MIKQRWIISLILITISNRSAQLTLSCSYGQHGSLMSTCYNANPSFFKRTSYRFDNFDETVRCVNCTLQVIESGTFEIRGNQIKYLDLENSQMTVLKEKSFLGLHFLRKLNLKNNNIVAVPVETFQGAIQIELNLANNNIAAIENIFQGLVNIGLINLEGNNVAKISPIDIQQSDVLLDLNLAKNSLKTLEKDTFLLLPRLENLNLSSNPIAVIEIGAFRGLDSLEQLDLSRCLVDKIPKGLLAALHQLRLLDLAFNRLTIFQTGVFSGLPQLRKLNMSHNSIKTYLKTGLFSLHNLHSLDLSSNNIDDLDYKLLVQHLPALSFLGLANNFLPCYLKKEIDVIFEHDNLVLDLGTDVDGLECNDTRTKPDLVEETYVAPNNSIWRGNPEIPLLVKVKTIKLEYIDDFVNIGNEYVHRKYIQIQMVINPDNSENVDGCTNG
ncbi:hypothetical protein RN001_015575 [Aquatica leii]|uniref:Uncharacterized protein n=1 Tax=Aquatica leii TaxID=1421715 RepID=A0AAN7P3L4_9COLE|nr:hypothetical protein RN001_015575 [Aquatica leii]